MRTKRKRLACFLMTAVILPAALTAPLMAALAQSQNIVSDEDGLKTAILQAQPGEIIYVTSMEITKELYFERDVDITIASATGNTVTLSTIRPPNTYPFNFNGGNVNLTFENVVIQGNGTHVLMRCQSSNEVTRVITGAVFKNGYRNGNGGALFIENGNINVVNCTFENNTAARGAALYLGNNVKAGGNGDAVIENCAFINNTATDFEGGAVSVRNDYNPSKGNVTIINCLFENNSAAGAYSGGGALSGMGDITILNSRFINNSAATGGAISAGGKKCTITDSTVSGNRSTIGLSAAELYKSYGLPCGGGGIYSTTSDISLFNSAISNNKTTQDGGAVNSSGGTLMLTDCEIAGNEAGENGGGIWIHDLSNLHTSGLAFENNLAAAKYIWSLDGHEDADTHRMNILDSTYSASFTNAYNNYDVNYFRDAVYYPVTVSYYADDVAPDKLLAQIVFYAEPGQLTEQNIAVALNSGWLNAFRPSREYLSGALTEEYPVITDSTAVLNILYINETVVLPEAAASPEFQSPPPEPSEPAAPPVPSPGQELIPREDDTFDILEGDGTPTGQAAIPKGDGTYDIVDRDGAPTGQTVIPKEDGVYEVVDEDGVPLGQWENNENNELIYDQYPPVARLSAAGDFDLRDLPFLLAGLLGLLLILLLMRRNITRAEFVDMIVDALRPEEAKEDTAAYEDVPDDSRYYRSIMRARSAGLLADFGGSEFKPEAAITREEIAGISAEAIRYKKPDIKAEIADLETRFIDYDKINKIFLPGIGLVCALNIMPVSGGAFNPKGRSKKGKAKRVLDNLLRVLES